MSLLCCGYWWPWWAAAAEEEYEGIGGGGRQKVKKRLGFEFFYEQVIVDSDGDEEEGEDGDLKNSEERWVEKVEEDNVQPEVKVLPVVKGAAIRKFRKMMKKSLVGKTVTILKSSYKGCRGRVTHDRGDTVILELEIPQMKVIMIQRRFVSEMMKERLEDAADAESKMDFSSFFFRL